METSGNKRLLIVWLVLVAITLIYVWMDRSTDDNGVLIASTAVTVAAIGLALVKYRIIMREFMDVRHAPLYLRRLTDLWVALIVIALFATYFAGKAVA